MGVSLFPKVFMLDKFIPAKTLMSHLIGLFTADPACDSWGSFISELHCIISVHGALHSAFGSVVQSQMFPSVATVNYHHIATVPS